MPAPLPDEVKAKVLADLALGYGIRETSRKHSVNVATVIKYRDDWELANGPMPQVQTPVQTPAEPNDPIGDRVAQIMDTGMRAIINIMDKGNDDVYLAGEGAAGLASLLTSICTPVFRVLEALEAARQREERRELQLRESTRPDYILSAGGNHAGPVASDGIGE